MNMCTVREIREATTMNNHYTSLVNHDMHAGGW